MSNVSKNLLVAQASGNVAKQYVYRTRGKKTSIAKMPTRKSRPATEKEEALRERFAAASVYAQSIMTDEVLRKEYQKKAKANTTAANLASRDYLKSPKVRGIETDTYSGAVNSVINVRAVDDFRVVRVHVKITSAAGVLIEEGNAVQQPINKVMWNYTAQQNNASVAGSKITATAFDLPGNKGVLELSL